MKIVLGLEYRGIRFYGWQRQEGMRTVQMVVEDALSKVADHGVEVVCAGRTDTGVHAVKQVIHFITDTSRKLSAWVLGCNSNLPEDVSVLWAREADDEFHARFSALSRTYRYYILNRTSKPAVNTGLVSWECRKLDIERMRTAAEYLKGEHNFNSFRAVACQAKNPVRTIHSLEISQTDNIIVLHITANAFLQHMVRNIAGVLMAIGYGKKEPGWAREVLLAQDRTAGGVTATPAGLYLYDVTYPDSCDFPAPVFPYIRF